MNAREQYRKACRLSRMYHRDADGRTQAHIQRLTDKYYKLERLMGLDYRFVNAAMKSYASHDTLETPLWLRRKLREWSSQRAQQIAA